jgi:hypothetical protein
MYRVERRRLEDDRWMVRYPQRYEVGEEEKAKDHARRAAKVNAQHMQYGSYVVLYNEEVQFRVTAAPKTTPLADIEESE